MGIINQLITMGHHLVNPHLGGLKFIIKFIKSPSTPFFYLGQNVEMFIHVMDIFESPGTCDTRGKPWAKKQGLTSTRTRS